MFANELFRCFAIPLFTSFHQPGERDESCLLLPLLCPPWKNTKQGRRRGWFLHVPDIVCQGFLPESLSQGVSESDDVVPDAPAAGVILFPLFPKGLVRGRQPVRGF